MKVANLDQEDLLDPSSMDWPTLTANPEWFEHHTRCVSVSPTTPEHFEDEASLPIFSDQDMDPQSWSLDDAILAPGYDVDVDALIEEEVHEEELFSTGQQGQNGNFLDNLSNIVPNVGLLDQDGFMGNVLEINTLVQEETYDEELIGTLDTDNVTAGLSKESHDISARVPPRGTDALYDTLFNMLVDIPGMDDETVHAKVIPFFEDPEKWEMIKNAFTDYYEKGFALILPDDLLDLTRVNRSDYSVAAATIIVVAEQPKEERGPQNCKLCGALRKGHVCPFKVEKDPAMKKKRRSKRSLKSGN